MMLVSIGSSTIAAPTSYSPGDQLTRGAVRDSPARSSTSAVALGRSEVEWIVSLCEVRCRPLADIVSRDARWQHLFMDELQAEADQVRRIVGRGATPRRRKLLNQALSSKWEGTQAHAIKALAAWGDRESVETIRDFLITAFEREYGWAIRGGAIRALVPIVGVEDVSWIGELCRARSSGLERHELRVLIERIATFPKR